MINDTTESTASTPYHDRLALDTFFGMESLADDLVRINRLYPLLGRWAEKALKDAQERYPPSPRK